MKRQVTSQQPKDRSANEYLVGSEGPEIIMFCKPQGAGFLKRAVHWFRLRFDEEYLAAWVRQTARSEADKAILAFHADLDARVGQMISSASGRAQ